MNNAKDVASGTTMSESKWIWMAVDADEYELPQAVADSSAELARKCNTSKHNIETCARQGWSGKMSGRKFVIVPREDIE